MESCNRQFEEQVAVPSALEDIPVVGDHSYAAAVDLVAFHIQALAGPCMGVQVDACAVAYLDACILAVASILVDHTAYMDQPCTLVVVAYAEAVGVVELDVSFSPSQSKHHPQSPTSTLCHLSQPF